MKATLLFPLRRGRRRKDEPGLTERDVRVLLTLYANDEVPPMDLMRMETPPGPLVECTPARLQALAENREARRYLRKLAELEEAGPLTFLDRYKVDEEDLAEFYEFQRERYERID